MNANNPSEFFKAFAPQISLWDKQCHELSTSNHPYSKIAKSNFLTQVATSLDSKMKNILDPQSGYFKSIVLQIPDPGVGSPEHLWKHDFSKRCRMMHNEQKALVKSINGYSVALKCNLPCGSLSEFFSAVLSQVVKAVQDLDKLEEELMTFRSVNTTEEQSPDTEVIDGTVSKITAA